MHGDLGPQLYERPERVLGPVLAGLRQIGLQGGINPKRVRRLSDEILDRIRVILHGSDSLFGEGFAAYERSGEDSDLDLHEKIFDFDESQVDCCTGEGNGMPSYWHLVQTFAYPRACPGDIVQLNQAVELVIAGGKVEHELFVVREITSRVVCGHRMRDDTGISYVSPTLLVKSARCVPFDIGNMSEVSDTIPGAMTHYDLAGARVVGRLGELGAGLSLRADSSNSQEGNLNVWSRTRSGN